MSTVVATENNSAKPISFQAKCELFNKQCAVMLGFIIPISTFGTNVLLMLFLFSWFLSGNLAKKAQVIWKNPVAKMALLLFGIFCIGYTYTVASSAAALDQLNKMAKLLYLPFLISIMIDKKWRDLAFIAFISAMLLTLFLSILKQYGILPITNRFTAACVFRDHIYTNLMMSVACFMLGHFTLSEKKIFTKIIFGSLLVATGFYVLFMSQGRVGYVLFLVLGVLLFTQRYSLKGILIGFLGSLFILGIAYNASQPFREGVSVAIENIEKYRAGESNTSVGSRLEYYRETWQLSKQHPWFGHGTGSFIETFQKHATQQQLLLTDNPHNEYLNIFFQLGLLGLGCWLAFLSVIFRNSLMLPQPEQWIAQGILIAMLVGCMLNSWLMDFTSGYLFIWMIAISFGAYQAKAGTLP